MAKTATRSVELEPIDRLEEKVKLLVSMVERMKAEQARAAEENQHLSRELDSMRARLATSDGLSSELSSLIDAVCTARAHERAVDTVLPSIADDVCFRTHGRHPV